ncbi:hypothetical protein HDV02_004230 [Globomyces sp. JEL0801]|nr:hypothetical protein HDV02_004230 [Globomyces sp. JEL0801]
MSNILRNKKILIAGSIIFALLVLPTLCYFNIKAAFDKSEGSKSFGAVDDAAAISVHCNLNSYNYAALSVGVRCVVGKHPEIQNITISGGGKTMKTENKLSFFESSYSVIDSTPSFSVIIHLDVIGASVPTAGQINFASSVDGWSVVESKEFQELFPVLEAINEDRISFTYAIVLSRSVVSKLFSIFIFIMMWVLSLTAITLSSTIWLRNRKVEPPTIAIMGGLLFALPSIRNSQPGAPMIGTTSDIAGFFFNMVLVCAAMVMLMWNYVKKYKADPAPPKPVV